MSIRLNDLPSPPPDKQGFPWTEGTAPLNKPDLPKISVITPSYNQGDFLEETIRSVLLQGYPNLEYIVVDGGSQDQSVEIIQKYADFLAFWVSQKDRGQTHAINKGMARATGQIMGWLNSDDLLLPHALQSIGQVFHRESQTQVICGFRKLIDPQSDLILNWFRGTPKRHHLRHRNIIAQETVYWRREVWEKLGELDESLDHAMDYEYWQRMLAQGYDFRLIPQYLGCLRYHPESKTMSQTHRHKANLRQIYPQYGIGADEDEALSKIGWWWRLRYDLTKDLCHQSWFMPPTRALRIVQIIENPVFSPPLLLAYWVYRKLRGR